MVGMYFRLKKTNSTPVLQLVESYRDSNKKPRQKILLSLGSADLPKELWKAVAEGVDNHIKGILTLFPPSKEEEKWIERIVKELTKKNKQNQENPKQPQSITINPDHISHFDTTELGPSFPS